MKRLLKTTFAGTLVSLATAAVSSEAISGELGFGGQTTIINSLNFTNSLNNSFDVSNSFDATNSFNITNSPNSTINTNSAQLIPGEFGFGGQTTIINSLNFTNSLDNSFDVSNSFDFANSFNITNSANSMITANSAWLFDALLQVLVGTDLDSLLTTGQSLTASDELLRTVTFAPQIGVDLNDDLELSPGGNVSQIERVFSGQVIPEPATLGILGAAIGAFGLLRRRKWGATTRQSQDQRF